MSRSLNWNEPSRLIMSMSFQCPICHAERPDEVHLDWCTYDGPEPESDDD